MIVAGIVGFLIVLICAAYYVYGSWPRRVTPAPARAQQSQHVTPQVSPQAPAVTSPAPSTAETAPVTSAHAEQPSPIAKPSPTAELPHARRSAPEKRTETQAISAPRAVAGVQEEAPVAAPPETQQLPQPSVSSPPLQEQASLQPPQPAPVAPQPAAPPVQPAPVHPAPPARQAYNGPLSGWLIWTGKLGKNETLSIDGTTASTGALEGELPGVPVNIVVDVTNIGLDEEPSPRNGWKRLVLRSLGKHSIIRVHWTVR